MWSLDDLKKLQQKKYRQQTGCFIAEGEHLVEELLRASEQNPALLQAQLFVTPAFEQFSSALETHVITPSQMARISDTKSPQGVLAVLPMAAVLEHHRHRAGDYACYFHEVQDPGNLGTILRTLAWFGNARCLLSPGSVDPFNPKVVRASMGAIFHVPVELDVAPETLAARFTRIACLDMHGAPLTGKDFGEQELYVFGNEARGLPESLTRTLNARAYSIPGTQLIESLNLATVLGICAYERSRGER